MAQSDFITSIPPRPSSRARVLNALVGAVVGGCLGLLAGAVVGAVIGAVIDTLSHPPEVQTFGAAIVGAICAALSGSVAGGVVGLRPPVDQRRADASAPARTRRSLGVAMAVGSAVGAVLTLAYAGVDHGRLGLDEETLFAAAFGAVFGLVGGIVGGWVNSKVPKLRE